MCSYLHWKMLTMVPKPRSRHSTLPYVKLNIFSILPTMDHLVAKKVFYSVNVCLIIYIQERQVRLETDVCVGEYMGG